MLQTYNGLMEAIVKKNLQRFNYVNDYLGLSAAYR